MPPPPEPKGWWNADFRRRLGYYSFGIAIGFMALGFFYSMKAKALREQAASNPPAATNPIPLPNAAPAPTPSK